MSSAPATPVSSSGAAAATNKKKRRPRSLLVLLKSFTGMRVRIDLKNDSVLEGVVLEVLHDMDFTLLDAIETKPNGKMQHLDEVFVMGKTILYVHIPDRINIAQHLHQYNRMVRQSRDMYKRDKRRSIPPPPGIQAQAQSAPSQR